MSQRFAKVELQQKKVLMTRKERTSVVQELQKKLAQIFLLLLILGFPTLFEGLS